MRGGICYCLLPPTEKHEDNSKLSEEEENMSVLQTITSPIFTDSEVSEPENNVTYFSEVLA